MRGWSRITYNFKKSWKICPAYAGMIPRLNFQRVPLYHLSRVCGDDPRNANNATTPIKFVPRMRGWSWKRLYYFRRAGICPAYAGMILKPMIIIMD